MVQSCIVIEDVPFPYHVASLHALSFAHVISNALSIGPYIVEYLHELPAVAIANYCTICVGWAINYGLGTHII